MTNIEATLKIDNCMDCPYHLVQPDPDPYDWFCDDDEKVVCTQVQTKDGTNRVITCACRPYQKRAECEIPDWCPLNQ